MAHPKLRRDPTLPITWRKGRVFHQESEAFAFDLLIETRQIWIIDSLGTFLQDKADL